MKGPQADDIQHLFGSIVPTYDRVNAIITLGMAQAWRKKLVKWSGAGEGNRILDCATGTGDLAIHFKRAVGSRGHVVGSDFCKEMLQYAWEKTKSLNHEVTFEWGDSTHLKYEDNSFDISSIAYGIRNVSDPQKALSEMARVVKPHGYVMVLETGDTWSPLLQAPMNLYFRYFVPFIGGWISGDRKAYQYLTKSSCEFPCRDEFVNLMMSVGLFKEVHYKSLIGGASFIYKATVI